MTFPETLTPDEMETFLKESHLAGLQPTNDSMLPVWSIKTVRWHGVWVDKEGKNLGCYLWNSDDGFYTWAAHNGKKKDG